MYRRSPDADVHAAPELILLRSARPVVVMPSIGRVVGAGRLEALGGGGLAFTVGDHRAPQPSRLLLRFAT